MPSVLPDLATDNSACEGKVKPHCHLLRAQCPLVPSKAQLMELMIMPSPLKMYFPLKEYSFFIEKLDDKTGESTGFRPRMFDSNLTLQLTRYVSLRKFLNSSSL